MGSEWRQTTLDHLGRIVTGKTPPASGAGCFGGDIPFVTPKDFDGRRIILSTERYLTELGAEAVAGSRIPARAVMVSCIGSDMGKAAVAGRECVTNQQINSIVVESGDDPLFVYYELSTRKGEIQAAASGSAQPILNKSAFGQLDILMPPLPEQCAIAHILGTLDDKIELNRKMNETLEAMARAIFKSWFVDFDPVRAKAEGHQPIGMDLATAALFPDSFEDSELGKIPKGWKVGRLCDNFRIVMGQSPPGYSYNEIGEGIPFYQGRSDFGFRYPTRRVFCTSPARFADKGDSLISVRAPVGSINMAVERCCVGRGVAAIRHLGRSRSFTYYSSKALQPEFEKFEAMGTVFGAMGKADLGGVTTVLPPESIVNLFEKIVSPFDQQIKVNEHQNLTLANLRDALLPKLMSGEIRIKVAKED